MGAEESHIDLKTDTPMSQSKSGVGAQQEMEYTPGQGQGGFPEEEVSE